MKIGQRWIQGIECAAIVALAVAAYTFGHHNASETARADKAQALVDQRAADAAEYQRQAEQTQGNAQRGSDQAQDNSAKHAQIETQFRTITRTVTKYVEANPDRVGCALGADGLRAWREANAGSAEEPAAADH